MKSLRKRLLTLLALTLFGGAGAWAQGPTQVTQITTDLLPASWETENSNVTLADLQALGFEAVDASVAQAWTGAPQGEYSILIFGFNDGDFNYIAFDNRNPLPPSYTSYPKSGLYEAVEYGAKYFYTGSPAIELTKSGANQWSLGQTPDYDLELQVEYYQKYALKNIPEGWQVKVDGVDKTAAIDGDSLKISETAQVLLTPDHPEYVKSVTLVEPVQLQTVTIGNVTLQVVEGETWRQIAQRNPGVITADDEDNGYVYRDLDTVLRAETAYMKPTDTYNSSLSYYWYEY